MRPAQGRLSQRGNVLDADGQPGQHRAVAHAQMHKRRQNGQRQSYGDVADEGEVNEANNMPRVAFGGRLSWNRNVGGAKDDIARNESTNGEPFSSVYRRVRLTASEPIWRVEAYLP